MRNRDRVLIRGCLVEFVLPIRDLRKLCGTLPGCVSVFTDAHRGGRR